MFSQQWHLILHNPHHWIFRFNQTNLKFLRYLSTKQTTIQYQVEISRKPNINHQWYKPNSRKKWFITIIREVIAITLKGLFRILELRKK
jgi:hypothetical protein